MLQTNIIALLDRCAQLSKEFDEYNFFDDRIKIYENIIEFIKNMDIIYKENVEEELKYIFNLTLSYTEKLILKHKNAKRINKNGIYDFFSDNSYQNLFRFYCDCIVIYQDEIIGNDKNLLIECTDFILKLIDIKYINYWTQEYLSYLTDKLLFMIMHSEDALNTIFFKITNKMKKIKDYDESNNHKEESIQVYLYHMAKVLLRFSNCVDDWDNNVNPEYSYDNLIAISKQYNEIKIKIDI